MEIRSATSLATLLALTLAEGGVAQTTITVNALAGRHPISQYVYGAAFPTAAQLADLNMPLCRYGGNQSSRYNWQLNCDNRGNDWYFETFADTSSTPGERCDTFIANAKATNSQAMITIPMVPWLGKLGPGRSSLRSFSVAKYGPQTGWDPWQNDAGNGISTAQGNPFITGNDPTDDNVPNSPAFQQSFLNHLQSKWGLANAGGLRFYIMDNEPSLWNSTHRDVHPVGETYDEILGMYKTYALNIRNTDPGALIVGPEEWGWTGYFYSGYDAAWGSQNGWGGAFPDKTSHGNMDHIPWLLQQLKAYEATNGKRLLDVLSVHYYPQQGEFGNDDSSSMQAIRNRSTRSLWDPNYRDTSWINSNVQLIPRLKNWVSTYYPGLQTAITEYNWGDDNNLNGGTAQADILGIFGREGLDYGSRWTCPDTGTPTYFAFKIFRNYDGAKSTFGDQSVSCVAPNPDSLSAFASQRSSDGAITVVVVNKVPSAAPVSVHLTGLAPQGPASVYQFSSPFQTSLYHLQSIATTGGIVTTTVPGQSVTLFVIPAQKLSLSIPNPGQLLATPHGNVNYPLVATDLGNPNARVYGNVQRAPIWVSYDGKVLSLSPPAGTPTGNYPVTLIGFEAGSAVAPVTVNFMVAVQQATLQTASFNGAKVASGASTTLTVKLTSPAPHGGLTVSFASKDGLLKVPTPQSIAEGDLSITIPVTASSVLKPTTAVLNCTVGAKTIQATIRVGG